MERADECEAVCQGEPLCRLVVTVVCANEHGDVRRSDSNNRAAQQCASKSAGRRGTRVRNQQHSETEERGCEERHRSWATELRSSYELHLDSYDPGCSRLLMAPVSWLGQPRAVRSASRGGGANPSVGRTPKVVSLVVGEVGVERLAGRVVGFHVHGDVVEMRDVLKKFFFGCVCDRVGLGDGEFG